MNLPEVLFAEKDPSVILQKVLASYENQTGRTLYPGDPVTLLLKSLSYVVAVQNAMIDLAAKQNLLAYATGAHLDHLGDLMGVKRIEAQPARCSMEFRLSGAMDFEVAIPTGTRVATKDGKVIFRTSGTCSILNTLGSDRNANIAKGNIFRNVYGILAKVLKDDTVNLIQRIYVVVTQIYAIQQDHTFGRVI